MKVRREQLFSYLQKQTDWTTAEALAAHFCVSSRQIRNIIYALIEEGVEIHSSRKGYRMSDQSKIYPQSPLPRPDFIIQKLLTHKEGVTLEALCETLHVSEATIQDDIKIIRQTLKPYSLGISQRRSCFFIRGEENDKRRFIRSQLNERHTSMLPALLQYHNDGDPLQELQQDLLALLNSIHLFVSDIALNNILLHILIAADRVKNGNTLHQATGDQTAIEALLPYETMIHQFIESHFHISLNVVEMQMILFIISCNTSPMNHQQVNMENISAYIDEEYISLSQEIFNRVNQNYSIHIDLQAFLPNFALHLYNLLQRVQHRYYAKNPLKDKIKFEYPFIYDVSVFIARQIESAYSISVNEDEITYLALHIGAYFQMQKPHSEQVCCAFIYISYYQYHKHLIQKITQEFPDLHIKYALPAYQFNEAMLHCDFVISLSESLPSSHMDIIEISTFFSSKDKARIRKKIDTILQNKKNDTLDALFRQFFCPALFYRNLYADDESKMIRRLSADAIALHYGSTALENDTLTRERMSSTALMNLVALPHALHPYAKRSFIAIVINDKKMTWGEQEVRLIAMIGIAEKDRKQFREIFDDFTAITYESANVHKLLQCDSYEAFYQTFLSLAKQHHGKRED